MVAISALFKSLNSLFQRDMLRLMIISAAITLGGMLLLSSGVSWLLASTTFFETGWLETVADLLGGAISFILPMLLFPAFMPLVAGFFEEKIITLVEHADYPGTPEPKARPYLPELMHDLKFAGVSLLLNLLLLPLYLFPLIGQFCFILLNGYLMGREFFGIAAGRHMGKAAANSYRKANRLTAFLGGVLVATFALVPVANLFVPFFGIVLMVHIYQALQARRPAA